MNRASDRIRAAARDAIRAAGTGARRFERERGLKPWTLRGLLDPKREQAPSVDRAADICAALGLELTIRPRGRPPVRQIEVVEIAAAAGGGTEAAEERTVGALAFRRDWLEGQGLDPTRCVVIGVRGASMEPTLPDGARILVDRTDRPRRAGRLYVLRTADGLVVKRAGRRGGCWRLESDNPAPDYPPAPWPADAETIGEVRWMARTFA